MKRNELLVVLVLGAFGLLLIAPPVFAAGDPERGAKVFSACAACHSLEPGRHMSGPSLAGIYGREAATIAGFGRYSEALEESDLVWNEKNLDAWLEDPQALVPGNLMTFRGISNAEARADLIALLKQAHAEHAPDQPGGMGGMGGMMAAPQLPDLKQLPEEHQVKGIRYCGDSYFVALATGETVPFWEFNLRFKTDSNPATGPLKDKPVIVGAGMRGDRASIVFSSPGEISRFVQQRCE